LHCHLRRSFPRTRRREAKAASLWRNRERESRRNRTVSYFVLDPAVAWARADRRLVSSAGTAVVVQQIDLVRQRKQVRAGGHRAGCNAIPVNECGPWRPAISEIRNCTIKAAIPNKHSATADPISAVGDGAQRHRR
jgi:hypothetical protein